MRKVTWAGIALVGSGLVFVPVSAGVIWTVFAVIIQLWWVLPISASLGSLAALATHAVFGSLRGKKGSSFPTPAYLISGPSMAALNIASFLSLGTSPPPWAGSMMLALLCLSALFYYHDIKQSDEDRQAMPTDESPFSSPNV